MEYTDDIVICCRGKKKADHKCRKIQRNVTYWETKPDASLPGHVIRSFSLEDYSENRARWRQMIVVGHPRNKRSNGK